MKNLNRINNFSFAAIATALIVTAGLAIGVSTPAIISWQQTNIDKLLSQANRSDNPSIKLTLLSQAATLGKNDPLATYTYANYLWQEGDYEASIDAYTNSWLELDYNYLGTLALKASRYSEAKSFYEKANSEGENAESLSGLAIVEFNNGSVEKGCKYSGRAIKLNLSSPKAEDSVAICQIYKGESSLGARQQAYTLLNSYLYSDSLDRLQKLEIKSTSDWLAIASIHSNNGKAEDSIAALKSALEQSPADKNILQKLAMQTKELGGEEEAKLYTNRLEELKFNNY